jgi:sugar lactone lactonase YvrE
MTAVDCVLEIRSILGEGPIWDEAQKCLYWLDLRKPAIYRFDPKSGKNSKIKASLASYVGGMVLRAKGGMMVADQRGIFGLDPKTGQMKPCAKPA